MATLTLKNLPDALYERLKKQALRQRRSINQEAIVCIEQCLGPTYADEERLQEALQAFRERAGIYVTRAEIEEAIDEGRE
ncbi:MAG: hypothetical protein IT332_07265 [Ardenticatenales bacterium]|nr:hypothetical protein [Ardenticatenales bacterium]